MACCGGAHTEPINAWSLFQSSSLPKDQIHEVQHAHHHIQDYLEAYNDAEKKGLEEATKKVLASKISPTYTSPSIASLSPKKSLLLSLTSLYYLSTLSLLTPTSKIELSTRLSSIPSFGSTEPQFTGSEVDEPASRELNAGQLEALMRVGGFLFQKLEGVGEEKVRMWRELADASASLWEIELPATVGA